MTALCLVLVCLDVVLAGSALWGASSGRLALSCAFGAAGGASALAAIATGAAGPKTEVWLKADAIACCCLIVLLAPIWVGRLIEAFSRLRARRRTGAAPGQSGARNR